MSSKKRILYISQEVTPFLKASEISSNVKTLAQKTQESGKEIRVFMPRYGLVNERRNQLHEVIRLSGMNMIINDVDHPLIIKVASIPSAKMQVYFIDNQEFFKRKAIVKDEKGKYFDDNTQLSFPDIVIGCWRIPMSSVSFPHHFVLQFFKHSRPF